MHNANPARMAAAVGVAAVTAVALTGCIPGPPPVPQPAAPEPIVQGEATAGEAQEGFVAADSTSTVELHIDARTAVAIGASSLDDEDLTLHLTGAATDVENDDAPRELDVFDFEQASLDPALATVLEPGDYTIEVGEWSDSSSRYELQVLTSTTTLAAGDSADFQFGPGQPALVIVRLNSGDETITATSDVDTSLWAYVPAADEELHDDDSGGDRNPLIELGDVTPQDIVVVATGYDRDDSGTLTLTVE